MKKEHINSNSGFTTGNITQSVSYLDFYTYAQESNDLFKRDLYSSRPFHTSEISKYLTSDFWDTKQIAFETEEENECVLKIDDEIEFNEVITDTLDRLDAIGAHNPKDRDTMTYILIIRCLMYSKFNYVNTENSDRLAEYIITVRGWLKTHLVDKGKWMSDLPRTLYEILTTELEITTYNIKTRNTLIMEIILDCSRVAKIGGDKNNQALRALGNI